MRAADGWGPCACGGCTDTSSCCSDLNRCTELVHCDTPDDVGEVPAAEPRTSEIRPT